MKIWIYLNGLQQGPYSLEELEAMNIATSTPVWYEGLSQWMPACEAPLTAELVGPSVENDDRQECEIVEQVSSQSACCDKTSDKPQCPPTYMAWAVFSTLCCCLPSGIAAIVFSSLSAGAYNKGDYAKAEKMSEYAQWAIMISLSLGLPLMVMTSFIG